MRPGQPDDAILEVIRARLSAFGPLPLQAIAEPLELPAMQVSQALAQLEREGYVLRGRFTPGNTEEEWCERHLLARIHRYTVKRLRREIEPVALQDFMRFLFDWQHLSSATRGQGSAVLPAIVAQFEGYPAAASAWDSDLLPARLKDYSPTWLDDAVPQRQTGLDPADRAQQKHRHRPAQHADCVVAAQSGRSLERLDRADAGQRTVAENTKGPRRPQPARRAVFR